MKVLKQYNIPGPPPHFLWGNVWDIYEHGHLVMQKRWHKQYGPVVGYYLGSIPVVIISDPELLKLIQLKDFHNFVDRAVSFLPQHDDGYHTRMNRRLLKEISHCELRNPPRVDQDE